MVLILENQAFYAKYSIPDTLLRAKKLSFAKETIGDGLNGGPGLQDSFRPLWKIVEPSSSV